MRLLVLAILLALTGCEQGTGFVHGERLEIDDCGDSVSWEPFDMSLEFLGVVRATDVVMLRASATSQWPDRTDSLLVQVASHENVREQLAELGAATLEVNAGDVAIGLSLMGRCPDSVTPLVAMNGTVVFSELGTVGGDQVTGTLTFDLFDQRSGELVGVDFEAALDFEVMSGTPFELFSDVSRQHGE